VFQTLVVPLVLSRLDYGNATLVGLPANLLNRLQSVLGCWTATIRPHHLHLPVFTGCMHLNASSLNWQSLSTEVFTALHLGVCLICCTTFQTSHQDAVRSSTSSELVIPLSRLVITVGDRSFSVAGPRLWNTLPEDVTYAPSLLVFRRKLKTHLFRQSYPDIVL